MRYGKTMTTATILTALLAAAPLTAGAQSKMEETKDKAKAMTQDAKTAVSDSWITSKTKIALFADERVKGTQVSVDTMKGGVVHLRGKVDSAEAKAAAEDIAKGIEGVKSVKNDLQVVAPGNRKMVDAKDGDIDKAVKARLSKDAQVKSVDVRTDAGVVTLTGEVPNIVASAKASEMARSGPRREVGQERADGPPGQQVRQRQRLRSDDMAKPRTKGSRKIKKVMGEYKRGTLRSSSGGKVRKRKQAVAIALSEARQAGARIPAAAADIPGSLTGREDRRTWRGKRGDQMGTTEKQGQQGGQGQPGQPGHDRARQGSSGPAAAGAGPQPAARWRAAGRAQPLGRRPGRAGD